jgi:hypothetical protein
MAPGFVAYWTNNGQRWILARDGLSAFDPKQTLGPICLRGRFMTPPLIAGRVQLTDNSDRCPIPAATWV